MLIRSRLLGLTLAPYIFLLSGCGLAAFHRSISGPDVPKALKVDRHRQEEVLKEIQYFQEAKCLDGRSAEACEDKSKRKTDRNRVIYDLKLIIDRNFEDYSRNYEQVGDTVNFSGETTAASLSGVATVVGDAGEKALLSLASTLTQSTLISSQKNFYQKQTIFTILAVMESQRLDKWKDVVQLMQNDDEDQYPLSAALADLAEYRRRGTALAALESIEQTAGSKGAEAKQRIDTAKGINQPNPPPAPPSSLKATPVSSSQIDLSWTASSTAGVTYSIFRSRTKGFDPSTGNRIKEGVNTTTYSDTGVITGTTYYYVVESVAEGAEPSPSNEASAETP